ncbi:MAG: nucleoside monophosphate kinase [Elusimicrobiota bacterium]
MIRRNLLPMSLAALLLSLGLRASALGQQIVAAPISVPVAIMPAAVAAPVPVPACAMPDAQAAPLNILLMGPPGSGKSTFGKLLEKDFGMPHISVGALLREKAETDPALAEKMAKGELVDSALVLSIVTQRLALRDVQEHGVILDGFPRRMEEASALKRWSKENRGMDAMIVLKVSEQELLRRIRERGRPDDTEETFKRRMSIYKEQTLPAMERLRNMVRELDLTADSGSIEENYAKLRDAVEGLRAGATPKADAAPRAAPR